MVSETIINKINDPEYPSLNPCSCGGWSQSYKYYYLNSFNIVLILVLVEDGLRAISW